MPSSSERDLRVSTPHGPAAVVLGTPAAPRALALLGHGAGGAVDTPDLLAVRDALLDLGVAVGRVTQPYRLAGRRAPAPASQLDSAWLAVCTAVRERSALARVPLLVGGRSSGARVACRTASAARAGGVLALAYPLHPPGRPERSRAGELLGAGVPVLVVQGERDAFGRPAELPPGPSVRVVPGGDHAFAVPQATPGGRPAALHAVAAAVRSWVGDLLTRPGIG